ncbi:hypothetical protein [Streptomyces sp. NPDC094032]|uniref:hypothetical protein n=1 Tax=Streptomyces sp. NPDC094032 TaxID=3155308 RepID=UPI00332DB71D
MAFPTTPLDVRVELQVGGTWTDITVDSYTRSPIGIECGRSEESVRTNPGKLSLEINNRSGKYSPRNPRSPYFGLIGRNTPVRISVKGAESYLALDASRAGAASTPDHASLGITGDLDVRVEAQADWYSVDLNQTLAGQWGADGNRAWMARVYQGAITLFWTTGGTVATQLFAQFPLPALPRRAALRLTLDVNNGAGGYTAAAHWARSLADPWTLISTATGTGVTSIYNSTAALEIGPTQAGTTPLRAPLVGRVSRAEVRNGLGGTIVAAPDFRALPEGTTSLVDSTGKTWTVAAPARVSDREYRFHGDISAWPARWDVSGNDRWVPIEAAGILRRLGQGTKPLASTLRRRIPSGNPLAYWPMEEGASATRAPATDPRVAGATYTGLDWAADTSLPGSLPLPKLKSASSFRATVPASPTAGWQIECVYFLPTMPVVPTEIMRIGVAGSAMRAAVVYASTAGIRIEARAADDTVLAFFLYNDPAAVADFTGVWNRLSIFTSDAGGGVTRIQAAWRDTSNSGGYWTAGTTFTGTMGSATQILGSWSTATEGMSIGHIAAFAVPGVGLNPGVTIYENADDGFDGEQAAARMLRLASEESATVALTYARGGQATAAMGPQLPAALLTLLQDAADADGGILGEALDDTRLVYRDRWTLYNQTPVLVLDYTANGEIGPPLEPTEDDQKTRNDITVSRVGGSSGRAVRETGPLSIQPPPYGVGVYEESVTLNLAEDHQAEQIAGWRLNLGTWDEARYASVHLMLHAAPHLIPAYLSLRNGDRIRITNPPPWLPPGPIDLIVQGWAEVLDQFTWDAVLTCTPAGPWTVGVVGDPVLGRLATDGCTLGAGISATATTLTLVSSVGRWVDSAAYPARFPLDVLVGGERIRLTAITGTTLTQTATGTRAVNGITKAHAAGAVVQVADPARIAL